MDLVISPVAAALNARSGSDALALQPGQIVGAVVARVIDPAHAQLALGATLIDVLTEVPLVPGSRVQLAVTATPEGLRLVLIQPGRAGEVPTPTAAPGASPTAAAGSSRTPAAGVVVRPHGAVTPDTPAAPAPVSVTPAAAVVAAARAAAATQSGLAPLLADAAVAVGLKGLPEPVRQAALKLLSFQLPSDNGAEAGQLRRAFVRSGIFLEANLAAAARPVGAGMPALSGDLKAALVALRAALVPASAKAGAPASAGQGAASAADAAPAAAHALVAPAGRAAITDAQGLFRALLQAAGESGAAPANAVPASAAAPAAGKTGASPAPPPPLADERPPPPYRKALPAAQPQALPSIEAGQPVDKIAQTLLAETERALSRLTLLQVASLPEQAGAAAGAPKPDAATQRWAFEIPFATPQGPAIAQFEIAGDAQGRGQDRVAPIWRARFAVDIEPLGAIHAQVAVMGGRTSVTLWAERAASAVLMREGAQTLADDLRAVELEPLEVIVRDGAPRPPAAAAPSGRFLDRAS